jgi:hypothetical protein
MPGLHVLLILMIHNVTQLKMLLAGLNPLRIANEPTAAV